MRVRTRSVAEGLVEDGGFLGSQTSGVILGGGRRERNRRCRILNAAARYVCRTTREIVDVYHGFTNLRLVVEKDSCAGQAFGVEHSAAKNHQDNVVMSCLSGRVASWHDGTLRTSTCWNNRILCMSRGACGAWLPLLVVETAVMWSPRCPRKTTPIQQQ